MRISDTINEYLSREKKIAPLITFRVLFGLLMALGGLRLWSQGWIEKLYIEPNFFFKFYGFEWVTHPGNTGIYIVVALSILGALGIAFGLFYRISAITFFLSFTYLELIDATNYLNHYYLVCLIAFLLIFLPANQAYSLDVKWRKTQRKSVVPAWCIDLIIFQISIVYFLAGVAKLNSDWLFHAMPLRVWLPEHAGLPIVGSLLNKDWLAYAFSFFAAFYDLSIAFWLMFRKTRSVAYVFVVLFHGLTFLFFNIGLFPIIMITFTTIFFSEDFHTNLWSKLSGKREADKVNFDQKNWQLKRKFILPALSIYALFQLLLPLRHHLYPNNVLWTEEGYRFSWRVMVVEKHGSATFTVKDAANSKTFEVDNSDYLSSYQEKQMAIQFDFILQFAHHIADQYKKQNPGAQPEVYAHSEVALNGRLASTYVRGDINLLDYKNSLKSLPIFEQAYLP